MQRMFANRERTLVPGSYPENTLLGSSTMRGIVQPDFSMIIPHAMGLTGSHLEL